MRTQWIHQVAHAHTGLRPFRQRELGRSLWLKLRERFQERVLAAILMPNHLHVLAETARPGGFRRDLACTLRGFTREFHPGRTLWETLPPPDEVLDRGKLRTVIRYIHLNPCRAGLTSDPWDWEFSTLRDHCRQSLSPWIDQERLTRAVGYPPEEWRRHHEAFLQWDPSVDSDLLEQRLQPPDLRELSIQERQRLFEWATHSSSRELDRRGGPRDWRARITLHLEPTKSLRSLETPLGIPRERLALLRSRGLSPQEVRTLESIALSIRNLEAGSRRLRPRETGHRAATQ